jgi:acetyl-CoA acetyltransferase
MTRFGRFFDRSLRSLAEEAVQAALADAGIGYADLDAVYFANAVQGALDGQHSIRGQMALRGIAQGTAPVYNIDNACASASTALHLACHQIRAGAADVVLVVGAEKMCTPDKATSLSIFNGSWDVHDVPGTLAGLARLGAAMATPAEHADPGLHSVFMDVYQSFAKFHMHRFGTTVRQIAAVASKNHGHSTLNPLAQYQRPFSIDEILAARVVSWPLTVPMCSPVSDGAAAVVVCSPAALARFDRGRAVRVRASAMGAGRERAIDDYRAEVSHLVAQKAYEMAGLGPRDVSLAEVHDASALGEIQQSENLMLCEFGDGGPMAERGETKLGGRIPINTSGGLECRGHPIGATGLAQVHELVTQLRHEAGARQVEGARIGIAENGGGLIGVESAAVCVTILER